MSDDAERRLNETDRPYGHFTSPQALIQRVELQFYKQERTHRQIAENCGVALGVVTGILAKNWGMPEWYCEPSPRGRPPSGDERLDDILHIRVSSGDKKEWSRQAADSEMSLSAWCNWKLNS